MTPRHRCSVRPMAHDSGSSSRCDATNGSSISASNGGRVVGRAVVDDDDFEIGVFDEPVGQSREAPFQSRRVVVDGKHHADRRSDVGAAHVGAADVRFDRRFDGTPHPASERVENGAGVQTEVRDGEPRRPRQVVQRLAEVDERQPSGDEQTPPAHDEDEVAQAVVPTPARLVEPAARCQLRVAPTGVLTLATPQVAVGVDPEAMIRHAQAVVQFVEAEKETFIEDAHRSDGVRRCSTGADHLQRKTRVSGRRVRGRRRSGSGHAWCRSDHRTVRRHPPLGRPTRIASANLSISSSSSSVRGGSSSSSVTIQSSGAACPSTWRMPSAMPPAGPMFSPLTRYSTFVVANPLASSTHFADSATSLSTTTNVSSCRVCLANAGR